MKLIFIISSLYFALFFSPDNFSQVNINWAAFYAGPGNSGSSNAIVIDNSGNVYVTGRSDGVTTNRDIATVKYNNSGVQLWAARFNGTMGNGEDVGWGIAVDNSGNVFVCGTTQLNDTNYDFVTIKYNPAGTQQWVRTINGSLPQSDDIAFSIITDNSGNIYVTGYVRPAGGGYNMCTVKYSSDGNTLWTQIYSGPSNISAVAYSVKLDGNGNVYVGGECGSTSTAVDYCVVKYNSNGITQWVRLYSGISNDFMHGFAVDNAGYSVITGESSFDFCTMKLKPNGDSVWIRRYNGPENGADVAYSVTSDQTGNAIVTGINWNVLGTASAMCTIKYDTAGVQKWVNRFNGSVVAVGFNIVSDAAGNSYVSGIDNNSSKTIKYNSDGVQQWSIRCDSIFIDYLGATLNFMSIDASSNVYVTGISSVLNTDYATIKIGLPIGIQPISSEIPNRFSLSQNYPNPFNPVTKFRIDIASQELVKVSVYDALGREVNVLLNAKLSPGTYELDFDGRNYPSGIYFYKLETKSFTDTKKMVLVK